MSETVTKQRPTVDLDDFERKLREHAHPHDDDPLAELARLVGDRHDPYGDVFANEAVAEPAPYQPSSHAPSVYQTQHRQEPAFEQPIATPRFADFAAIEAGLRGSSSPHGEPSAPHVEQPYYGEQAQADAFTASQGYDEAEWAPAHAAPVARSRRPVFIMAATIAVGVIGVGAAFALKGHGSSPSEIKTIMAASGPAKIQPPADAAQDAPGQDSALLGNANKAAPTKLVSHEEQPVDLAQTVQQNAARDGADAASVPVPLSPGQQQDAMNANPGAAIADNGFNITPKKVKSISVRPDGTILPNDQPPAAAMPPVTQRPVKVATAHPAAPAARTATPKSTSRVVTTTKPTQTADAEAAAPTPTKPVKKVKPAPQRVASAEVEAPATTSPSNDAVEPAATSGSGGWAVQLAAPTSEADAKAVSSKLGKKFADALSGHRLGFHKADSNGKTVYRVRVGSLSKDDANSLCGKLKADGGSCFVAKN